MSNTIDYLNDKGEVVFYVDPDKGIVGDYKNSDSIVLRNNLRPYIQNLKGTIIEKDSFINSLKDLLYASNKREFERVLDEKGILKALLWNSMFNTSEKLRLEIVSEYTDDKINELKNK